jgi:hypothetical protein
VTATNLGIIVQITTVVVALLVRPNSKLRWRDIQHFLNAKEEPIINASDVERNGKNGPPSLR